MGTFGNDPCPFTGGKFARVREGRGDTFVVSTPVLREEVELSRELFADLPGHPEKERLGLRRWVADMIEVGSPPPFLTGEHLAEHRQHPEPSPEKKAYRLLGWMVAERVAQKALGKKFEFGVDRVGALHEACLITESETHEDLADPLAFLHRHGYVEYLGPGDRAVTSPGLTVRLTSAGIENAGRVPIVDQASAHFGLGSRGRFRAKEINIPPGATVRQIEKIIIRTVDREVVRQNLEHHGGGIVDLTDVLIQQLDAVLEPRHFGDNNPPIDGAGGYEIRPELEALRATLLEFRTALASAVASPVAKTTKPVLSGTAKVLATLSDMSDIIIVRVPILAAQAMSFALIAEKLGIPVDLVTVLATMLGVGEAGRVADKATRKSEGSGS